MSEDTTNESTEGNAFEAPKADFSRQVTDKPILQVERFSAWGVFFLGMITMGIYNVYWLYSRTQIINSSAKNNKVNTTALNLYLGLFALVWIDAIYTAISGSANTSFELATNVVTIVNFISYLVVIYSFRSAVTEVINYGSEEPVKLGPILTFFFSSLYFQYKINEAIDLQK